MYFICCIKVVTGLWCLTPLSQVHPSLLFVKNPKHSLTTFVVASISVYNYIFVCFMVFNTTFANISVISWRSVLLVEETRVPVENHRLIPSHWQTINYEREVQLSDGQEFHLYRQNALITSVLNSLNIKRPYDFML